MLYFSSVLLLHVDSADEKINESLHLCGCSEDCFSALVLLLRYSAHHQVKQLLKTEKHKNYKAAITIQHNIHQVAKMDERSIHFDTVRFLKWEGVHSKPYSKIENEQT